MAGKTANAGGAGVEEYWWFVLYLMLGQADQKRLKPQAPVIRLGADKVQDVWHKRFTM